MLLSRDAITTVSEILKPEHFYRPVHADIFQAIMDLASQGEPVDAVTVNRELEKRGQIKRVGGAPYLLTLSQTPPSAINASSYATTVYDRWRQRSLDEVGTRMKQLASMDATTTEEVDELLAQADVFMRELGEPSRRGLAWDDLVAKWRTWQDKPGTAIPTPWLELNEWLHGGMHKGQLIIVGGRPGGGKSNAGLNMVLEAAEKSYPSTVFSVEMDDVEVASRLLAAGSWQPVGQLISKRMEKDTFAAVEEYIASKKGMPLEVVDQAYITVEQIVAHCRMRRPDAIFVDYAQLVQATNSKVSREQQVAHITRSLKVAAKHLQMAVVVAAQLNRGPIDRTPVISDLRESGAAEQDADVVLLLHRGGSEEGEVEMICGKNRNGPTGTINLMFRGALARVG